MNTIIALECPWTPLKEGAQTTLPMIDTLSRCINKCNYYSSIFYNRDSFRLALKNIYGASVGNVYLYIASHASSGRIDTYDGSRAININTLIKDINEITDTKLKGVVFGCCSIGNALKKKINRLNLNAKWIYGYKSEVDWWIGTIVDMNIIYNAVSCEEMSCRRIKESIADGLRLFSKETYIFNHNKEEKKLYENFVILVHKKNGYKDVTDDVKRQI